MSDGATGTARARWKASKRRFRAPLLRPAGIVGLGSAEAERLVTNRDLERLVDTSDDWIVSRTGIRERHVAGPGQASSDLATTAAGRALASAGIEPAQVDMILVATVTPDMLFPATACLVQRNLGARGSAGLDIEVGCAGFLYGLAIGSQFINTGRYDTVLVIGAETLSKITDWTDRNTCVLLGDGAGAAVLRPVAPGTGILATYLGADGTGAGSLYMPAGGSRLPPSHRTVDERQHYLRMNGSEVFKFAVRIMAQAGLGALRQCGLHRSDVDLLVPHQANIRIIEAAVSRLGLPWDRVVVNLDRHGNMSSASIPVALDEAAAAGRVKPGDVVLMVSFGAGLAWASCVVRWNELGGKA
jgi:3-oxoacyl-[acyl-carrier-protein] synthase-3